jgi:uncharacterized membrane protein
MRGALETGLSIGVAALLLAACARQDPQAPADAPARASPPASSEPAGERTSLSATEPPAESGLSIKRGVMMLAQDRTTFRPCDEHVELWVLDQTEGVLARTFAGEAPNAPTMLYVEAYGERAPLDDAIPQASAYGGLFVLEEALYAGLRDQVKGCAAPAPAYIVAARGTEPFWAAEVHEDQIIWRQPQDPKEILLSAPHTQDAEGAVQYRASGAGHEVDVLIDARPCSDAMSGEFFAYSARALLDGKEFNGCARVGR